MAKKVSKLDKSLRKAGLEDDGARKKRTKPAPVYQMVGDSRIPVTKAHGAVWETRLQAAKRKDKVLMEAWKESLRYYYNTATELRESGSGNRSRSIGVARKLGDDFSEIENLVFANTTALVPLVYSKNPTVEVTATKEENEGLGRVLEKLTNALMHRKAAPNFLLKNKMRRAVVMSLLTSSSFIEVGWIHKEQSSEAAIADLTRIAGELEKAKDAKTVVKLEGQLTALENMTDLLRPAGPYARYRMPWEVMIDPSSIEEDLSDARWIMIEDMIPTSQIVAKYGKEEADGTSKSIYKPTHVLKIGTADGTPLEDRINTFSLLDGDEGDSPGGNMQADYGFENKDAYDRAQFTNVWMVWDRATRRVLMYHAKDWSYPIWVWDDPYGLDTFFPIEHLSFVPSPAGGRTMGEVSYYLDQQDAINEMLSERRQARRWAQRNVVFNSNRIDQGIADALMSGDNNKALGVPLNEGESITDLISALVPPSVSFMELFDDAPQMRAIDRISSVADVLRGAQFKTNTTNDAVSTYNSVAQTRMDEKIDAIEDFSSGIMWKVGQMCLQFMEPTTVAEIVGQEASALWQRMEPKDIARTFSLQVIGGSVVKPNSAMKKQQAAELGQVLGQFAKASPMAIIVALQMFEKAFDEVIISAEDWQLIRQSVEQQLQGSPEGGEGNSGQPKSDGGNDLAQMAELIDSLPPEAKRAIGLALERGAPVQQILEQVMSQMQGAPNNA